MSNIASIIINIFVIILAFIGFLTSIGVLFLVFYHRRQSPLNAPVFLICNTCISIIFMSILFMDMYVHYLYGNFDESISFDYWWCYIRAYLVHVSVCSLFHSYLLQAIFRFFRLVFYQRKQLQTLKFLIRLVLIQWLIDFTSILPFLLLNYFHYIPEYYFCETFLTDTKGMLLIGTIGFILPMIAMNFIYFYILYYMKKTRTQSILQNRHLSNQRDLAVFRRIFILLVMLLTLGLPTIIVWFVYIITGYANSIGYRLGWSLFTLLISLLPAVSVLTTPQLLELLMITCRKNNRIQVRTVN